MDNPTVRCAYIKQDRSADVKIYVVPLCPQLNLLLVLP